ALLEETQGKVVGIGQLASSSEQVRPVAETVPEVVESLEALHKKRGKPTGISTGFVDLDRMTGGLQRGRTYYIGGRPAMGKSSIGSELAERCAEQGLPVVIFSVEMTSHELTEVMLCRRARVDLLRLRDGFFSKSGIAKMKEEAEWLKTAPIYIDDSPSVAIFDFRARARRAVKKLGAKLIVIDYVQRMRSISKRAQQTREQEINEIAQGISET